MGATPVILGSDLAREEIMMTLTHVETTLDLAEIMEISVLKPWDTFWYSERELLIHYVFVQGAKKLIGTPALSCLATSSTGLKCENMVLFYAVY